MVLRRRASRAELRCDHITPILKQLHWLPVSQRIIFELLLITYKALIGLAPAYTLKIC